jgi:hypothetical protein
MSVESLQRTSYILFGVTILAPICGAIIGAGAGVARFYVDRHEKTELRDRVDTLAGYAEVARLNFLGTSGAAIPPLVEQSAISRALQTAVIVSDNNLQYKCDDASIQIFRDVAARYPRFPFSQYALALCLQKKGDATWRDHALKAVEILKRTTTIDGHHPNHDHALQELLKGTIMLFRSS